MKAERHVVQLGGRLGNLLFQAAWGLDLARRTGIGVAFRPDHRKNGYADLEAWMGPLPWITPEEEAVFIGPANLGGKLSRLWRRKGPRGLRNFIQQTSVNAETWHFRVRRPAYWAGYWQSAKYWTGSDQDLVSGLFPRFALPVPFEPYQELALRPGSCSLHVRRGDFVGNPMFDTLLPGYHQRALEKIRPEGPVLVFSDDVDWCEQNLSLGRSFRVVRGGLAHEDLQLMSLCEHHVVANSTFSWWGARLALRTGRTAAPTRWFSSFGALPNLNELYPPAWMVLE